MTSSRACGTRVAFAASATECEVETQVRRSYRGYRFRRDDLAVRAKTGYMPERLGFDLSRLERERHEAQKGVDVALAKLHESDATLAAVAFGIVIMSSK